MRGTKPSFLHFLIVHWCPSRMPFHNSPSSRVKSIATVSPAGVKKPSGKSSDKPWLSRGCIRKNAEHTPIPRRVSLNRSIASRANFGDRRAASLSNKPGYP